MRRNKSKSYYLVLLTLSALLMPLLFPVRGTAEYSIKCDNNDIYRAETNAVYGSIIVEKVNESLFGLFCEDISFYVNDQPPEKVNIKATTKPKVLLFFAVDVSGSMAAYMDDVKQNIINFLEQFDSETIDVDFVFGLMRFGTPDGLLEYDYVVDKNKFLELIDKKLVATPGNIENWCEGLLQIVDKIDSKTDIQHIMLFFNDNEYGNYHAGYNDLGEDDATVLKDEVDSLTARLKDKKIKVYSFSTGVNSTSDDEVSVAGFSEATGGKAFSISSGLGQLYAEMLYDQIVSKKLVYRYDYEVFIPQDDYVGLSLKIDYNDYYQPCVKNVIWESPEIRNLNRLKEKLLKEIEGFQTEIEILNARVNSLRIDEKNIRSSRDVLAQEKENLENKVEELKGKLAENIKDLEEMISRKNGLKSEIASLSDRRVQIDRQIVAYKEQKGSLEKHLSGLLAESETELGKYRALQNDKVEVESLISGLESEEAILVGRIAKMEEIQRYLLEKWSSLKQDSETIGTRIQKLEGEESKIKSRIDYYRGESLKYREEVNRLNAKKNSLANENKIREEDKERISAEIERMILDKGNLGVEIKEMIGLKDGLIPIIAKLREEEIRLSRERERLDDEVQKLIFQENDLTNARERRVAEILELNEKKGGLKSDVENERKSLNDVLEKLELRKKELESYDSSKQNMEKKRLENEISKLNEKCEEHYEKLRRLTKEVQDAEGVVRGLEDLKKQYDREIIGVDNRLTELKKESARKIRYRNSLGEKERTYYQMLLRVFRKVQNSNREMDLCVGTLDKVLGLYRKMTQDEKAPYYKELIEAKNAMNDVKNRINAVIAEYDKIVKPK